MNGFNNFDKTDQEYSQAPTVTWLDSGGQKSRTQQVVMVKSCEHRISWIAWAISMKLNEG